MQTDIIKALNWRYATKDFADGKKLSDADVNTLLEAARLSASSFGLQPWKFIVVTNPEVRKKLREAAWNQPQVTNASHLVVFTVEKNVDDAFVDRYVASVSETRGVPVPALKDYADIMKGAIKSRGSAEAVKGWSSRQVYIALGTLLTSAAVLGIDACPMEGFDNKKVDEILGLEKLGVESLAFAALGYRANEDEVKKYKKVRFPKSEVIVEIK